MDPRISPWKGYCVEFGALLARLLGSHNGTAGRPWPGFLTEKINCVVATLLPLRAFECSRG